MVYHAALCSVVDIVVKVRWIVCVGGNAFHITRQLIRTCRCFSSRETKMVTTLVNEEIKPYFSK